MVWFPFHLAIENQFEIARGARFAGIELSFLRWFYPSISDNAAWKRKPPLCHPERSRATVCFVKRVRVGLVVEKAWTGPTWETRLRFPLSPNAAAAGVFKKVKQQQVAPL
jgi:hypothetical protein